MSAGRKPGLFRGSEFTKLLILLVLMVVGWPLTIVWSLSRKDSGPPPPVPTADTPLPEPDDAIELKGVQDKTVPSPRDNPGYQLLFRRTRDTPVAELAAKSRRDVVFSQLLENPARYRGLPIHLEGTARRINLHDHFAEEIIPSGKFYEAWTFTSDSQNYPYVLGFEDAPKGLPVGKDIWPRVSFDGYFFKVLVYQDGTGLARRAPFLIGRLSYEPPKSGEPGAKPPSYSTLWVVVPLGALSLYFCLRILMIWRRRNAPPRPRFSSGSKAKDQIEPDALAEWVNEGPGGGDDEEQE